MGTYQYLHWKSARPRSMKRAVIKGELSRRLRICSTKDNFKLAQTDLTAKLLTRHYPIHEIEEKIKNHPFSIGRTLLNKTVARIRGNRKRARNPYFFSIQRKKKMSVFPLTTRYDLRNHREIKRIRTSIQSMIDSLPNESEIPRGLVIAYEYNHKNKISSVPRSKS
jgi:hypothetical protein